MSEPPKVVLGTDRTLSPLKDEREYSSTVENFFLHSSVTPATTDATNIIDDQVVTTTSADSSSSSFPSTTSSSNKPRDSSDSNNPYAMQSSGGYNVSDTLDVCRTLTAHMNMDAPQQGGEVEAVKIIDVLLEDPVACGYMELFAKRTFCSENLAFVMAVQMFMDVWVYMNRAAEAKIRHRANAPDGNSSAAAAVVSSSAVSEKNAGAPTAGGMGFSSERPTSGSTGLVSRKSDLSVKSMQSDTPSKHSEGTSNNTQLSDDLKRLSVEAMGPRIAKRIISDASKIWFMFIDEKGENQISVDHKSLMSIMASVWGPHPPSSVTVNLSQPDLRKISALVEGESSLRMIRRSSIARLIKIAKDDLPPGIAEDGGGGSGDCGETAEQWIPGPDSFQAGVVLAKKSLENHVVPNFLASPEFRVYQKRCGEAQVLLDTSRVSSISMSAGPMQFVGLGETEWPIRPTVSLLDDAEQSNKLLNGSIQFTLDVVLSDRYLFERFLTYLKKRYCPETLLCYRSLQLFRLIYCDWANEHGGRVNSPDESSDSPIERLSWTVAMFFLSRGVSLEVPVRLSTTYMRHLSYKMANPTVNLFSKVERACYGILKRDLFVEFAASDVGRSTVLMDYMKGLVKLHKKESRNGGTKGSCAVQ
jgi:hypothetical protein